MLPSRQRAGRRSGGHRAVPASSSPFGYSLCLPLLLLATAATTTTAFLLPAHQRHASRQQHVITTAVTTSTSLLGKRLPLPVLRAAAAAPCDVDAKSLDAWAAQWKQDNAQVGV